MTIGILNLDACVPAYHEALRFLSYSLGKNSVEVVHLGCDSALQRCVNINSRPTFLKSSEVDALKRSLCTRCRSRQGKIGHQRSFAVSKELDKLNPEQESLLSDIGATLQRDPRGVSVIDFKYKGVEFSKIAFFDFSMATKAIDLASLDEEEVSRLKQHIRDALLLQNFLERVGRECDFDTIYYVNGNYSHNTLARAVLKNHCREFISMEFQFSSHKVWNRIFFERDRLTVGPRWPTIRSLEASYKLKKRDLSDALHIMQNRFLGNDYNSYTKPGSGSQVTDLDAFRKKYKTVISYFSCSTDELYSHKATHGTELDSSFYSSQYELLDDFFKNANSEFGYVIRVHPRLAPNKRDRQMSREIAQIKHYLDIARTKENFLVIEAENPLSSYYLILQSDLVVVAWSTIALEASVAGIPAFALFPSNCMYPMSDFCRQPIDVAEFRRVIGGEIPLSEFKSKDVQVMKWISMTYSALAQPIPSPRGSPRTLLALVYYVIYYGLITRTWAYNFFMVPLSLFASNAVDRMILKNKPLYPSSADHDDVRGGLRELTRFRRKIRTIRYTRQA